MRFYGFFFLFLLFIVFSTGSAPHGDLTLIPKGDPNSDSVFAFFLQNSGNSKIKSSTSKGYLSLCELLGIPNKKPPQGHLPPRTNQVKGNLLINILGVGESDLRRHSGLGLLQKTLDHKWVLQFDKRYSKIGEGVSVLTSLLTGVGYNAHQIHDPFWLTTDYKPKNVINDLVRENRLDSNIYSISSSKALSKFAFGDGKEEANSHKKKKGIENGDECWYLSKNGKFNSPQLQKKQLNKLIKQLSKHTFGNANNENFIELITTSKRTNKNNKIVSFKISPFNQKIEFDLGVQAERDFVYELIMVDQLLSLHNPTRNNPKRKKDTNHQQDDLKVDQKVGSWTITFDSIQRVEKKKLAKTLRVLDRFLSAVMVRFVKMYQGEAAIEMLLGGKNHFTQEERHSLQSSFANAINNDLIVTDQADTEKLLPEIYLSSQMGNASVRHVCEKIKQELKYSQWEVLCSGIIGEDRMTRGRPDSTKKWYARELLSIKKGSLLKNRKLTQFLNSKYFFENSLFRFSLQFFFALMTLISILSICSLKIKNDKQNIIPNEKKNK
ncbi:hypothetical protein M0812_11947 [Anaeramoeba flamelloides]|uniref:Uncharacterized protein n=1 Tax=Anaeramoeba flamelloides TaxID=1746091 RepID=A0AAV7ZJL5_9EUKA|nr:hypothetical protein M0812_11947 [Anaeramoeba flamelloides]